MPGSVPVLMIPPSRSPAPPKKKILFYKFSNENIFNVPMKESITLYNHLAHPRIELLAEFFLYMYIYIKNNFSSENVFSHPLKRTDVLSKRKNFLCFPEKITEEKISYNYQKKQSSKQKISYTCPKN